MTSGIGTLWAIGAAKDSYRQVLRLLAEASGRAGQPVRGGGIGPLDIGYLHLCAAVQPLSLLRPGDVRSAANAEAGDALAAIHAAVAAARAAYGPSAGPDRSDEDTERFRSVLLNSIEGVSDAFPAYAAAVSGLDGPSMEEWLGSRRRPERQATPVRLVPSVPVPRDSEATAAKARAILGEAYGVLGAAYMMRTRPDAGDVGRLARFEVMALSGAIAVQSDSLSRRCAAVDRPYADTVAACSDAIENLADRIEGRGRAGAAPHDALRNCALFVADRIRRMDAARAVMAHAPDDGAGPRP